MASLSFPPSLLSMTLLFLTLFHTSQIFFSVTCFPFTVATGFPHCLYINSVMTKKQEPQSVLEVIWREEQTQVGTRHKDLCLHTCFVENTNHFPSWRAQASLLGIYSRNCSQRKRERNVLYSTLHEVSQQLVGVSWPKHQKELFGAHTELSCQEPCRVIALCLVLVSPGNYPSNQNTVFHQAGYWN